MAIRIVQFTTQKKFSERIENSLEDFELIDSWEVFGVSDEQLIFSIIITLEKSQTLLDKLQFFIDRDMVNKVVVTAAEAILPKEKPKEATKKEEEKQQKQSRFRIKQEKDRAPREELYNQLANDSVLTLDTILLTLLSTIVAALGLLQNQVIAVIAAMVIAPMLVPNLALALSAVLGDFKLFLVSIKSNGAEIICCLLLSVLIGFFWTSQDFTHSALVERYTQVGYSDVVLALASGAAGALSLTSRFSAVLVGVMVAAALLPPLTACGLFFGSHRIDDATSAGILFCINIVCVSLTANLVFLFKGVHPQKWYEKKKAKKAIFWYLLFWIFMLLILCAVIFFFYTKQ